jgi:hypothetical protein
MIRVKAKEKTELAAGSFFKTKLLIIYIPIDTWDSSGNEQQGTGSSWLQPGISQESLFTYHLPHYTGSSRRNTDIDACELL